MKHLAIWASGAGSNAQQILDYFENSTVAKVVLLISNKHDIPFNQFAVKYNIPIEIVSNAELENPQKLLATMKLFSIDLHVLAGFLRKIPSEIIEANPNKIINIHPSLLPKYGGKNMYGMRVHQAVFNNRETESGITIHAVNERYDEGIILFQATTNISHCNSAAEIQYEILKLEHTHYKLVIERLLL